MPLAIGFATLKDVIEKMLQGVVQPDPDWGFPVNKAFEVFCRKGFDRIEVHLNTFSKIRANLFKAGTLDEDVQIYTASLPDSILVPLRKAAQG